MGPCRRCDAGHDSGLLTLDNVGTPQTVTASYGVRTATGGATVTFAPVATDLLDGTSDVVYCSPGSGSTFPVGVITVHCDAKYGALIGSSTFTIT